MTQTPNPPAGWYPQGDQERWWNGSSWSENYRPLGSEPTQAYAQQPYGQPAYGQPVYYGQPQFGAVQKSHTARNILIVFGVLFLIVVGGCVAVVAVVGKSVNDAVNDDTPGGPNNPLTITEGEAFSVHGFDYAAGWDIKDDPLGGLLEIDGLEVTNNRGKADRLFATINLLNGNEIVATATCTAEGIDKIPEGVTAPVDCSSADDLPAAYDEITIKDAF